MTLHTTHNHPLTMSKRATPPPLLGEPRHLSDACGGDTGHAVATTAHSTVHKVYFMGSRLKNAHTRVYYSAPALATNDYNKAYNCGAQSAHSIQL